VHASCGLENRGFGFSFGFHEYTPALKVKFPVEGALFPQNNGGGANVAFVTRIAF
jgi:hypothetical protein